MPDSDQASKRSIAKTGAPLKNAEIELKLRRTGIDPQRLSAYHLGGRYHLKG
jgi:hypothetical protein